VAVVKGDFEMSMLMLMLMLMLLVMIMVIMMMRLVVVMMRSPWLRTPPALALDYFQLFDFRSHRSTHHPQVFRRL
jgi:carbon starvation protein CstA